jgi:hypothetical protein
MQTAQLYHVRLACKKTRPVAEGVEAVVVANKKLFIIYNVFTNIFN